MIEPELNLLALSGSLRQRSYNSRTLRALIALAPAGVEITLGSIAELPLFNPDREDERIPSVQTLNAAVERADGLIIASPEYAHGISGPMKNALDWLVSGTAFPGIPIMLINTSPTASHALAALKEVLRTMSGNLIESAELCLPLLGSRLIDAGIIQNDTMAEAIRHHLGRFCVQIRSYSD